MSRAVLDASALIAFLFQESGAEVVAARIPGSLISAVNYSEVVARASPSMPRWRSEPPCSRPRLARSGSR
jgi:PIN domain nuclease of toxin-antitoxin system